MQQAQGLCFLQTGTEGQTVHIAPQAYLGAQSQIGVVQPCVLGHMFPSLGVFSI